MSELEIRILSLKFIGQTGRECRIKVFDGFLYIIMSQSKFLF